MFMRNYSDMVTVSNANYDWVFEIEDAETLLRCAWDRFFAGKEQGLNAGDALEVGTLLRVCCDRIYNAVLSYRLAVGEDGPGVEAYFFADADYHAARDLNKLASEADKRDRELTGAARDAWMARRLSIANMPVPDAIKAYHEMLKGGNGNET